MTSKVKSKGGFVTDHAFENLTQGWKLRCDESVDEVEYEKDLRMILKEMQQGGSGSRTTEHVGGSQGSLATVAAPRPASMGERRNSGS